MPPNPDSLLRRNDSPRPYAYCVKCGYMFIKTPPLPPVPCRCGAMAEAER